MESGARLGRRHVRRMLAWEALGVLMSFVRLLRIPTFIVCLALALPLATRALAQSSGAVDCGNGYQCPSGNACLLGGLCALIVDAVPGSVRTSTGAWCDPGFRESKYSGGGCVPGSYTECSKGVMCPPGTTCGPNGSCDGGPPPTGPLCGKLRCVEGRICASTGRCMNTQYFQDCGNGTICSKSATCQFPSGCVLVSQTRTKQVRKQSSGAGDRTVAPGARNR